MRHQFLGVLVLLVVHITWRAALCQNQEDVEPFGVLETSDGIKAGLTNYEDDGHQSNEQRRAQLPPERDAEQDYSGYYNGNGNAGLPQDKEADLAYWESIYGTEDVPDFEEPPSIDGESIFMDIDDLGDPWDDLFDEQSVPIKLQTGETQLPQMEASLSAAERSEDANDFQSMVRNAREDSTSSSDMEQLKSDKTSKSDQRLENFSGGIMGKAHDIDDEMESEAPSPSTLEARSIKSSGSKSIDSLINAKLKLIQAKKDFVDLTATGGIKAELADSLHNTIQAKKDLVDSVHSVEENAAENAKEFVHSLVGSFDHGHTSSASHNHKAHSSIQSVLDAKRKVIQAQKDLIHAAAEGGSKAELTDAVVKTLEAKNDLLESVVSTKCNAIQGTKEFVHFLSGSSDHGHTSSASHDHKTHSSIQTSGSTQSQGTIHSVLDSKRKVIQAKKDLIHVAAGRGSKTELADAVVRTLNAKKDLVDSVISAKGSTVQSKKKIAHSHSDSSHHSHNSASIYKDKVHSSGLSSSSTQSQCTLQSVLDSKRKCIQAKKDLLHVAIGGGSKTDLADAVGKTLDAKKGLVDSVRCATSGRFHNKKESHQSTTRGRNHTNYQQHQTKSHQVHHSEGTSLKVTGHASSNLESELMHSQSQLVHAGDDRTELTSSSVKAEERKTSSLHSSLKEAVGVTVNGEIGVTSSPDNGIQMQGNSVSMNNEIRGNIKTSSDVETAGFMSQDGISSSASVYGTGEAKLAVATGYDEVANGPSAEISAGTSSSDSISEEIVESADVDIQASDELSGSSKQHSNIGVAGVIESESSLNSEVELGKKVQLEGGIHLSHKIEGKTISAQSHEKSSAEIDRGFAAANEATGNIGIEANIDAELPPKNCAAGECGVSGKLHVDLETESEIDVPQQNLQPAVELEDQQNLDGLQNNERYSAAFDIQSSFRDKQELNAGITLQKPTLHVQLEKPPVLEDEMYNSGSDEEDSSQSLDVNAEADIPLLIDEEETEAIDATEYANSENEHVVLYEDVTKEDEDYLSEEVEHSDIKWKHKGIETQTPLRHEIIEDKDISIDDTETAIDDANTSSYEEAAVDVLQDDQQNENGQKEYANIDVIHDNAIHREHSSTYETTTLEHDSDAEERSTSSQGEIVETGKLSHFHGLHDCSQAQFDEDTDYYEPADRIFSNAHCRLINLDVNCTESTAFMNPECQHLNVNLWHPQDAGTPITLRTVKAYLSHGHELAIEMQNRAKWLFAKGFIPKLHTPSMLHLINNLATANIVEINHESELSLFSTKLLQRRLFSEFDVTPNTFVEFLHHHAFRVIGTGLCHVRPKRCPTDQIYRTFDGSCNNPKHPSWGQCNTAFSRVLPARYSDGVHEPPRSVTGHVLPNPRLLSVRCFSRKPISDHNLTLATVQWGQILSHDFALQTIDQTVKGGIQCCADGKRQLPKNLQHHSCLPIDIPADDEFYSKFDNRCMNFVRSMTISREDCTLGPADQLNTVTSYVDASPLYGSDKETCDKLRTFQGGRLLVEIRRGRQLLPTMTNTSRFCDVMSPSEVCYLAGDRRVNQNPQLAIIQTALLREHNRVADELGFLNPHWDDERIFQETRRIVIAEYQHITYHEWLPLVVGKKYCQRHKLTSRRQESISTDYDPRIKATTINSFTTAAFRFFHSMIDGSINLCPANREISHTLRLSNHYFRPQVIERNDNFDDLIRGLVSQPMQRADDHFHPEVTEYLFRSRKDFGLDLAAIDIQRGRDHGLQGYNAYRRTCGLRVAKAFEDLVEEILPESIKELKKIYTHVDDVDLIVGLALEKKSSGSILGPVARCLIGEQFYRSRIGDRFFYDNALQPQPFTQEQLEEIRKVSFARILCDTGDNIEKIQTQAFRTISADNPLEFCYALPRVDLSPWQELRCD